MNPREHMQNVEVFSYSVDSLAQWKIERGRDMRSNAGGCMIASIFFPFMLLGVPYAIWYGHKGKVLQREGEAEGAKGRPLKQRGSRFVPPIEDELRCDAAVRRVKAPIRPPASLLPASDVA
jgi:hypothetical protein